MAFTVQDFQDLLRLLEQHPEWRADLRRHVLSEELLGLPALAAQLVEQVQALALAQTRTEQRLETLTARVDQLALQVDRLAAAVDELARAQARTEQRLTDLSAAFRGFRLEWRYRERADAYFGRLLRRLRVHSPSAVADQYEDRLPQEAMLDLLQADLLLQGQPRQAPERGDVWLAVEVSTTIDSRDLERALRRAGALRQAGLRALPAVAGDHATPAALQRARAERVVLLQDGSVTGWEEALAAWAA